MAEHIVGRITLSGGGATSQAVRVAELEAALAEMRQALMDWKCPTCGGTGIFKAECWGCLSGEPNKCTCSEMPDEPCPQCKDTEKDQFDRLEKALSSDAGKSILARLNALQSELGLTLNLLHEIYEFVPPGPRDRVWERIQKLAEVMKG